MASLLGIVATIVAGMYGYLSSKEAASFLKVASGFNWMAWTFTFYMVVKLVWVILTKMPHGLGFATPRLKACPSVIDADNLPVIEPIAGNDRGSQIVSGLVTAVMRKIRHAADEAAIHSFMNGKLTTARRELKQLYSGIKGEINTLAFEGAVGTILGMMTFLAQAVGLFLFPDIKPGADPSAFIGVVIGNLRGIDLYTVMTAFITSLIGWGTKGWLGKHVDDKLGENEASLVNVENWLQDEILARLRLASITQVDLRLKDLSEITGPLAQVVAQVGETVQHMGVAAREMQLTAELTSELQPVLFELGQMVQGLHGGTITVRMTENGYKLAIAPGNGAGGQR